MKSFATLSAVLLCAGALSVAAQTTPDKPAKIGVVAFQTAVTQTNEFRRDFADLQKKYEPKRQELKTLSDQVEALKKQMQAQGDTLSENERESRARAISEKEKQLQRTQEDDQNDFQQDMQQTFNAVASKVGTLLIDYAQKQGYTLVMDGSSADAQVVLYANASTDLTKTIIDAYNTKSGVPAQAEQPAAAAPRPATHPAASRPTQH